MNQQEHIFPHFGANHPLKINEHQQETRTCDNSENKNEEMPFFRNFLSNWRRRPTGCLTGEEQLNWVKAAGSDQFLDLYQGSGSCRGCKKRRDYYRCSLEKGGVLVVDELRIEQEAKGGKVRCALVVDAAWEEDHFWSRLDCGKRAALSKNEDVIDEKFLTEWQCIHCKTVEHFWIEKHIKEGEKNFSLCRRKVD